MNEFQEYHGELGEDGLPYGEGLLTHSNGDQCEGTFRNMTHGFVVHIFKNGSIMMGERRNGQLHGKVTFYQVTSDESEVFNQEWSNNKRITSDLVDSPD